MNRTFYCHILTSLLSKRGGEPNAPTKSRSIAIYTLSELTKKHNIQIINMVGKPKFSLIDSAGIEPAFLVAEATRLNNAKLKRAGIEPALTVAKATFY
ncbi:hypothetical protein [Bacillus halotolerans]|uniref:hypothetical protein n=1 Tax=Bacillus halotolerans TaxID=260554 RepID=UPI00404B2BAA